jgi:hypothetical protein
MSHLKIIGHAEEIGLESFELAVIARVRSFPVKADPRPDSRDQLRTDRASSASLGSQSTSSTTTWWIVPLKWNSSS